MHRRSICVLGMLGLLAVPASAQAPQHLIVQRAGQPVRQLTAADLAALPSVDQRINLGVHQGEASWSGPLLWDVLVAAAAIDPTKPAEQVRLVVRVSGADGYRVVFALAELSPEFAGRPVQLALRRNGQPLPGNGLRLVAPGEHRAGRSVREVVRVEVE